ncbi:O-succinylbenzoic acid--CoA ligase [Pullulanibacillus pueri]|uniref:2-succinylbenzoate--CoA ligase n=1 Tax=Pullulanibacillus pueri TaxID=1437324 RepID=A0A8J2ZY16_9BACL|nr:o-succinylbenzoate--CoA ligase [Pullulanibacillus pueri]MBM7680500.1 O-succinylbenzoic acid--CoA ligase [Pullulanibacillus pueri]GGH86040.1 2-succinylbenzoate--CoA ligase [Pullulanibacillus pueri]
MENVMPHWLEQRAFLTPDRVALETEAETLTFRDMNKRARSLAAYLNQQHGIKSGMTVAFLQENTVELILSYYAVSYLGAIAVPLNIRLSAPELTWQLQDSEATLLLYDERQQQKVVAMDIPSKVERCHINNIAYEEIVHSESLKSEINMDDPHTIIYTSGTTGKPKGVILSYKNHWGSAIGSVLNLGLTVNDKWLACVPLFHVSGLSILMRSVIYGMTVRLHRNFDPVEVHQAIMKQGVTVISVVTAMFTKMMELLEGNSYPETFRCMLLGGGPVPQPLLKSCIDKNVPVYQTYGLSETASQIVTLSPEYMVSKAGSAGKPLFPSQIKIVDEQGQEVGAKREGEIVVKGPNVTSGYFKRPEANQKAIKEGWLHTGDIGYLDEDGFLYVLDRRKDLIVSGGENVYPAEIEAVLLMHPSIEEVGVVGMKDEKWGRVPCAFIKVRPGAPYTDSDLQMYCRDYLAKYKVPQRFITIDELPRNASRKLLRRKLVERLPKELQ